MKRKRKFRFIEGYMEKKPKGLEALRADVEALTERVVQLEAKKKPKEQRVLKVCADCWISMTDYEWDYYGKNVVKVTVDECERNDCARKSVDERYTAELFLFGNTPKEIVDQLTDETITLIIRDARDIEKDKDNV